MHARIFNRMQLWVAFAVLVTGLATPRASWGVVIVPEGYVLLHTDPGTMFMGVPWEGVPLGTYDFGSGPVAVGNADTIVQRPNTDVFFPPDTLTDAFIFLVSNLKSSVPFDPGFGLGLDTYFMSLATIISVIDVTLDLPSGTTGTFDWTVPVLLVLREGSPSGPIVFVIGGDLLTATGVPWSASDPALHISGVNDGFTPLGMFTSVGETGVLVLETASPTGPGTPVPAPASAALVIAALSAAAGAALRRPRWRMDGRHGRRNV